MMKSYIKNILGFLGKYPSKTVIWTSLAIIVVINLNYKNWNQEYKIIAWDINHYYAYLPTVFIYGDLDMEFIHAKFEGNASDHYWPITTKKNKLAIMTSMGMSMMYAPFFLAGHAYVQITGYPGNEFSAPYKVSLILSCLFYFIIGLLFLRKVLLRYFSEMVTAITLLLIIFGTNLLHYVTDEPTMSHAYNFALISIFIFLVIKWIEKPGIKYAIFTGALAGLITLIRPSNIIVVLMLIFWGITSSKDLIARVLLYLKKWHLTLIMIVSFLLVWLPQFMYWYYVSGSIFLYSYGAGEQSFFFDNPQFYHLLFSYRKGWFVYTPVMFAALAGFFFLYKKNRGIFWPVLIHLILCTYILASWWSWWNGGSFGLRSFVDIYGLMAFPIAAILAWAFKQRAYIAISVLLIFTALLAFNSIQTWQAKKGILHNSMMTKTSYWHVFLRLKGPPQAYWDNLVFPDYSAASKGIYYTDEEVPLVIENKMGMRGWEYLDHLRDSFASSPEILQRINPHKLQGNSLDSLIDIQAKTAFDSIVDHYYRTIPNLDYDKR